MEIGDLGIVLRNFYRRKKRENEGLEDFKTEVSNKVSDSVFKFGEKMSK